MREAGAIDEIVVMDAASADGTAAVAERAGASVYQEAELMPDHGPVLGKGDAMWRALSVLDGEHRLLPRCRHRGVLAHFATGLLGQLVCEPGVSFVKALLPPAIRRRRRRRRPRQPPHRAARARAVLPGARRRRQPLAGEVAARRELLENLPFTTGYGVEIAMLIDAWRRVGLDGLAQVDLEEHRNRHQPLSALEPMAP